MRRITRLDPASLSCRWMIRCEVIDQMDYVLHTRMIGCKEVDQTDYVLEYEEDWIQEID